MCFFSKMVTFFLNVRFVRIFFKNCTDCTDFFKKIVRIVRIFSKKNVRIVRIFSPKMYGLYGFFLKMYGFLYGFFQKSFGHPVLIKLLTNLLTYYVWRRSLTCGTLTSVFSLLSSPSSLGTLLIFSPMLSR